MTITTGTSMTAEEFDEWANRPENAGKHSELERGEVVEVGPRRGSWCRLYQRGLSVERLHPPTAQRPCLRQ